VFESQTFAAFPSHEYAAIMQRARPVLTYCRACFVVIFVVEAPIAGLISEVLPYWYGETQPGETFYMSGVIPLESSTYKREPIYKENTVDSRYKNMLPPRPHTK